MVAVRADADEVPSAEASSRIVTDADDAIAAESEVTFVAGVPSVGRTVTL
jgi:hypothetical protein